MRTPLYLDCDTGIDDALALAYLVNHPDVEIVGIGTVSGNVGARRAAENTTALLRLAAVDGVPVAVGEHHPRAGTFAGGAPHVHGTDGIGNVGITPGDEASSEHAPAMLIRLARDCAVRGTPLHVLAIGPLTNIAKALELEPRLPDLVGELTIMGGAVTVPGNVTLVAEANIHNDPEAAQDVLRAGFRTTLVPLDVTLQHRFDDQDARDLARCGAPLQHALGTMLDHYLGFYETVLGVREAPLHDPLAAAIAVGEVAATLVEQVRVDVHLTGTQRGRTAAVDDTRLPGMRVIHQVGPDAASVIRDRIQAPTPVYAS